MSVAHAPEADTEAIAYEAELREGLEVVLPPALVSKAAYCRLWAAFRPISVRGDTGVPDWVTSRTATCEFVLARLKRLSPCMPTR